MILTDGYCSLRSSIVPSVLALSTTMIALRGCVWFSNDSRSPGKMSLPFQQTATHVTLALLDGSRRSGYVSRLCIERWDPVCWSDSLNTHQAPESRFSGTMD